MIFQGSTGLNTVLFLNPPPCQKYVSDIVPEIRDNLAIKLVDKEKLQATSAKLLEIAPSAVSQYILRKRCDKIEYKSETKELIEKLALIDRQ